jgi:hypothetical protein
MPLRRCAKSTLVLLFAGDYRRRKLSIAAFACDYDVRREVKNRVIALIVFLAHVKNHSNLLQFLVVLLRGPDNNPERKLGARSGVYLLIDFAGSTARICSTTCPVIYSYQGECS